LDLTCCKANGKQKQLNECRPLQVLV